MTKKISFHLQEHLTLFSNIIFALLEMDCFQLVDYLFKQPDYNIPAFLNLKYNAELALESQNIPLSSCLKNFFKELPASILTCDMRLLRFLFRQGIDKKQAMDILPFFEKLKTHQTLGDHHVALHIEALLFAKRYQEAHLLFPKQKLSITSPYYPLYGCFLAATQGEKAALLYFKPTLEVKHPHSNTLLGYFLSEIISLSSHWMSHTFLWEKMQLFRQLILYFSCLEKKKQVAQFEDLMQKTQKAYRLPLDFF